MPALPAKSSSDTTSAAVRGERNKSILVLSHPWHVQGMMGVGPVGRENGWQRTEARTGTGATPLRTPTALSCAWACRTASDLLLLRPPSYRLWDFQFRGPIQFVCREIIHKNHTIFELISKHPL